MNTLGQAIRRFVATGMAVSEEHERRMVSDPAYRDGWERREAEEKAREDLHRQIMAEDGFRRYGIPQRLWPILQGAAKSTEAMAAVRKWIGERRTFLVLAGAVGVGKTTAAAHAVAQEGGLFRKASEIAWLSRFDEEPRNEILRANLLAIDDLGTEPLDAAGWALSMVYSILDHRYDNERRTVITTNLGVEAFRQRYGQDGGRLFRRLRETGQWFELAANGSNQ